MAHSWNCEHPKHEGDRTRVNLYDRLEKRIEYRRVSDAGRERTITVMRMCKPCMRIDLGEADAPATPSML